MTPRAASPGMTLAEVMIASVIFAILLLGTVIFVKKSSEGLFHLLGRISVEERARMVNMEIQRDLSEMNEIMEIFPSSITFLLDSHRMPGYNPNQLVRGLPARFQPDQDGDAVYFATAPAGLRYLGLDLDDDDDDNDGHIDVQCRYAFNGAGLARYFNYNEAGWVEAPLTGSEKGMEVIDFDIDPVGSVALGGYAAWDTVPLGGDGVLSAAEIAARGGDAARIDTREELAAIASLEITVEIQRGRERIQTRSALLPTLLTVKRKVP